jgi:hypothetical protein
VYGPWRTVAYTGIKDPRGRIQQTTFHYDLLPNSLSADGKRFTLAFTGTGNADALLLVNGSFGTSGRADSVEAAVQAD